ncbi:lipopolysaccharide biosynthesis protein [Deinococcus arenicola]|uniref:Lipopolysaccharide biosynthesis protein n=1 Tax=Deinococcus arenicola TaxID=2994950 RepID=A0ABU4DSF9_9DEIO|nr:lipopolysaccharide biosynthesis protein [Deinococcus sp. ZS9-10]MDV6375368.1 lipopolysaccharide biosynthesis protein [Deinococcus sp. ZS9-10]
MTNLKSRTINAVKWSYLSMAISTVLGLVFAAILSRLLTPKEFGVVAIALVLQRFGQFIGDLGVGQALVQKPELSDEDVQAGFTSSLGLGLLATLGAWLLAPAAGTYFNMPDLVAVFRGYSAAYLLTAMIIISTSLLRRQLNFRPLLIGELIPLVIGHGVLGLGAAYLGFGAFSLAISALAQAFLQMVILYAYTRHSLRLTFRPESYRALYAFATRVTIINFLEFVSGSLDSLILGRLYPSAELGLYRRSYSVIGGPAYSFASSLTKVLAPSFSQVQGEPERLRRAHHSALLALLIVLSCVAGGIFVAAPEVVAVMLGSQFVGAVVLIKVFAVLVPFMACSNLAGVLAEATAHLSMKTMIQAAYTVALALAFWMVYRLGGSVTAIAFVLLGGTVVRNVALELLVRFIVKSGREIVQAYAIGALSGLGTAALFFVVVVPLRGLGTPLPVLFLVELLVGAVALAAAIFLGPPNELKSVAQKAVPAVTRRLRGQRG